MICNPLGKHLDFAEKKARIPSSLTLPDFSHSYTAVTEEKCICKFVLGLNAPETPVETNICLTFSSVGFRNSGVTWCSGQSGEMEHQQGGKCLSSDPQKYPEVGTTSQWL